MNGSIFDFIKKIDLFTVNNLFATIATIFIVILVLWVAKKFLLIWVKRGKIEKANSIIIYKIGKYFVIVVSFITWLDVLGAPITLFITSSTALFIGIGLGLQRIFQDIISGFFILLERTIHVGDILTVDNEIVKVVNIKLRTSRVMTRDNQEIIIPNYKLISENVTNWTTTQSYSRFVVNVGVAYGSDTKLVEEILLTIAKDNPKVRNFPEPIVNFLDFGSSSLDFKLLFFSDEIFRIEILKSELRHEINKRFNDQSITIPFPQQDVYIKEFKNNEQF